MTLLEIAQIYTDLVSLEGQIPSSEYVSKEEINVIRSKYHQFFMDKLREEGIEFADRFEATNIAFKLIKTHNLAFHRPRAERLKPLYP